MSDAEDQLSTLSARRSWALGGRGDVVEAVEAVQGASARIAAAAEVTTGALA